MSYCLRPARMSDLEAFTEFAFRSPRGLTSLPRNKGHLEEKLALSERSFHKTENKPGSDYYLFMLECLREKRVIGCSAVYSQSGFDEPLYYYRIEKERFLEKVHYTKAGAKLCSLFLLNEFRERGLGKFLSLARLHFIQDNIERFAPDIYAEMRGVILPHNYCPFWEAVGKRILGLSFEAFESELDKNHQILSKLAQGPPIDILTLPYEAQEAIGKAHFETEGARRLLEKEGFSWKGEISIDDGGPRLVGEIGTLRTIRESRKQEPSSLERKDNLLLVSNCHLDFRAIFLEGGEVGDTDLSEQALALLKIKKESPIRVTKL